MNENELVELELERDGLKIRLKRSSGQIEQIITAGRQTVAKSEPETLQGKKAKAEEQALIDMNSPMVGTFYRTPSPESAPFVDIGSEIQPGQVICIIEAMKLMNEVQAEIRGKIKEILVENGHPVEFGQVLFRVEPL